MAFNTQEAERAVTALLLSEESTQEEILSECSADMFTDGDCRRVFVLAEQMKTEDVPIDLSTVNARCESGFAPKLVELSQSFCVAANVSAYVQTIERAWKFRRASGMLKGCLEKAQKGDESVFDEMLRLGEQIENTGRTEEKTISEYCEKAVAGFFEKEESISTGFGELDAALGGGLVPGRLMVLGGRPGMGKSALALNMAVQAAEKGAVVLYISLEMTVNELARRAVCMLSGIDPLQATAAPEKAKPRLEQAGERLKKLKLYFRDGGDSSLASVSAACRRVRAKEGRLDLVVIDYVGLMRTERTKTSTRQQEIAEISRGLKQLSIRMPTCVLLLSQLNREAEDRMGGVPHLSDLRECGDLEQDADVVLFPVRGCRFDTLPEERDNASLYVAKNRCGRPWRIEMEWCGGTFSFREKAKRCKKA